MYKQDAGMRVKGYIDSVSIASESAGEEEERAVTLFFLSFLLCFLSRFATSFLCRLDRCV